MDNVRNGSATSNESKYMSKRARRAATSDLRPQMWINLGSELRTTMLTILKRPNSDFFDICWPTKIEKMFQAFQSTLLILHPVPCSFPFSSPRPQTLLAFHLCPPTATPVHPVWKLSDASPSCLHTFGSRLVKGGENRIHPRVSLPKGAGHHLFVFTSAPPSVQKEDEELGWGEQKCLVSLLILKLRIHEFPGDSETKTVSNLCFKGREKGDRRWKSASSKIVNTHACRLVEGVVKLCLHSDLSVRVGVDERKPQVGVVSTSERENRNSVVPSRNRKKNKKELLKQLIINIILICIHALWIKWFIYIFHLYHSEDSNNDRTGNRQACASSSLCNLCSSRSRTHKQQNDKSGQHLSVFPEETAKAQHWDDVKAVHKRQLFKVSPEIRLLIRALAELTAWRRRKLRRAAQTAAEPG